MKRLIETGLIGMALLFSGAAIADNPNWSPEKAAQVAVNRCANAGLGNGKEVMGVTLDEQTEEETLTCLSGDDLRNTSENPNDKGNGKPQSNPDIDPGNSHKNANNRKAPK